QEDAYKVTVKDRNVSNANEKQIHWIEVQYKEITGGSSIDFTIQPYDSIYDVSTWVGEVYNNTKLEGSPYIIGGKNSKTSVEKIDFNWGTGSPQFSVPKDKFSTRFTKTIKLEKGTYLFETKADDGVRVKVDGKVVLDSWKDSSGDENQIMVWVEEGTHKIAVEHYENTGTASL
ncbi:TPA: hypothetical protein M4455_003136, partial [Legionella pneumophila]|nr:hypothetical protein [Legionella pneumophila]